MKKHYPIIASGALLLAGTTSALAQENVSIYGVIDTFFASASGGGGSGMKVLDGRGGLSGSRLGFKGSEDLGNGLKAIYTLEYALNPDINSGITAARQQWVGVQGALGSVTAGFQYAPGYLVAPRFDPLEGSGLIGPRAPLASAAKYTIAGNSRARWSNSLAYTSPNTHGVTLLGIYANHDNEDAQGGGVDNRWGLGGTYNRGPLDIGFVFHSVGEFAGAQHTREAYLAVSYDFGVARIMGSWQQKNAAGSTSADSKLGMIAAIVPLSSSTSLEGGYARLNPKGSNDKGSSGTLGVIHNLSKRTTVYLAYNRLHYEEGATSRSGIEQAVNAGETANTYMAGIRHKF